MNHISRAIRGHRRVLMLLAVVAMIPATSFAEDPPQLLLQWGTAGTGPGQFNYPQGICVDNQNNVYVVDLNRVQKFTNNGVYLGAIGGAAPGSGPGQLNRPQDVAVDPSGNLYVTDWMNNRVQVFDSALHYVREWPTIYSQSYIALDPTGAFAYLDQPDSVRKFDTSTGLQVASWHYSQPAAFGIATGPSGSVYLSTNFSRVTGFSSIGAVILTWGGLGTGDGQFLESMGIGVGLDESVYVADENDRIEKFTPTGTFLTSFGNATTDLAVDSANEIFLLGDTSIKKYGYVSTPTIGDTWGRLKLLYK